MDTRLSDDLREDRLVRVGIELALAHLRAYLKVLIQMCRRTCGLCHILHRLAKKYGHFGSLPSLIWILEQAFSLEQVTCSLHQGKQPLKSETQISQVRAQKHDWISIEGQLWHRRSRERRVIAHHAIADLAHLVDVLMRQLDDARVRG